MGYVKFTEQVGNVSTTYEFGSYEDFKDWENGRALVNSEELFVETDGWTENKGYMPVTVDTYVDVKHRDGEVYECEKAGHGAAADWSIDPLEYEDGDITHYRVVSK